MKNHCWDRNVTQSHPMHPMPTTLAGHLDWRLTVLNETMAHTHAVPSV
jgi:hypothetical protein